MHRCAELPARAAAPSVLMRGRCVPPCTRCVRRGWRGAACVGRERSWRALTPASRCWRAFPEGS
eukprot:5223679-Alexandrium_andersonii.AAC.1